ncbi:hypothetical protein EHQ26_13820 [Leptospira bourretii]|uniref:Endonuclease/exonuclease/phosphatase family protein n=1 Tax=Leptospira bourretii TaxID=2484962 RepID=A0ABY2LDA5_9LEPT|nr:hypothetical protein [Leptospira bourretii]TGK89508.1 hypothetical protein EHQ26_13820 [Leptospira bourretii]
MDIYFWNINNKELPLNLINNFDFNSHAAIIGISEFWDQEQKILTLSKSSQFQYDLVTKRTGIYSSNFINANLLKARRFYTLYSFIYNNSTIYLYVIHLKSQIKSESEAYSLNLYQINELINEINTMRYYNSIIMGDFHIPFYDEAFFDHFKLNVTNYFNENLKIYKKYAGYERLKFYSPINSFNGDLSKGPPGTYYFRKQHHSQGWHIIDNILVSYPLSKFIDVDKCQILTELNNVHLLNKHNLPNKIYSDHLPIKITLK